MFASLAALACLTAPEAPPASRSFPAPLVEFLEMVMTQYDLEGQRFVAPRRPDEDPIEALGQLARLHPQAASVGPSFQRAVDQYALALAAMVLRDEVQEKALFKALREGTAAVLDFLRESPPDERLQGGPLPVFEIFALIALDQWVLKPQINAALKSMWEALELTLLERAGPEAQGGPPFAITMEYVAERGASGARLRVHAENTGGRPLESVVLRFRPHGPRAPEEWRLLVLVKSWPPGDRVTIDLGDAGEDVRRMAMSGERAAWSPEFRTSPGGYVCPEVLAQRGIHLVDKSRAVLDRRSQYRFRRTPGQVEASFRLALTLLNEHQWARSRNVLQDPEATTVECDAYRQIMQCRQVLGRLETHLKSVDSFDREDYPALKLANLKVPRPVDPQREALTEHRRLMALFNAGVRAGQWHGAFQEYLKLPEKHRDMPDMAELGEAMAATIAWGWVEEFRPLTGAKATRSQVEHVNQVIDVFLEAHPLGKAAMQELRRVRMPRESTGTPPLRH